ncbi:MAG: hypothetical protein AAFQ82_12565 [Myxococcota bacterium]
MSFEDAIRAIVREELAELRSEILEAISATPAPSPDDLLPAKAAGERVGLSATTVFRYARAKRINRYGRGRGARFSVKELRDAMQKEAANEESAPKQSAEEIARRMLG